MLRIGAFRTMDAAVRAHFHSPYLRQLFNRYATYNGSSPYLAPATLCLIPYIELAGGGWYIAGGLYRLVEALVRLAGRTGRDDPHRYAGAEEVLFARRRQRGGACAWPTGEDHGGRGGDQRRPALCLCGRWCRPRCGPGANRRRGPRWRSDLSCSGFVLLLGTDCDFPALAHHNIFFSADYPAEFRALFHARRPAPDPTIYISYTSRSDPTQAPPGGATCLCWSTRPPLTAAADWAAWAGPYRGAHPGTGWRRAGLAGLRRHIVVAADDHARRLSRGASTPLAARSTASPRTTGWPRSAARPTAPPAWIASSSSAAAPTPAGGSRWRCSRPGWWRGR